MKITEEEMGRLWWLVYEARGCHNELNELTDDIGDLVGEDGLDWMMDAISNDTDIEEALGQALDKAGIEVEETPEINLEVGAIVKIKGNEYRVTNFYNKVDNSIEDQITIKFISI